MMTKDLVKTSKFLRKRDTPLNDNIPPFKDLSVLLSWDIAPP